MIVRSARIAVRRCLRRFVRDRRGTAAMEFVIIVPVMFIMAYGCNEICNTLAVSRKITTTARTVSDIVAQGTVLTDVQKDNVMGAGKALLEPYSTSSLKIRVSAVNIDGTGKATIAWSDSNSGDARTPNDTVTIPTGLAIPNSQLIWGEVAYDFEPLKSPFGNIRAIWSYKYEDNQFFAKPRESTRVCRPPAVPIPC